jgi:hypothetical protein
MSPLAKFWSLTGREKIFFCEASLLLSLANICVKVIAFRHIDRFLRARCNDFAQNQGIDRGPEIRLVHGSISRAANVLPWKSLCLSRSIAEFIMLRRRSIPALMFAGVKFSDDSSLHAHAWVDADLGVNDTKPGHAGFTTVITIGAGAIDALLPSTSSANLKPDVMR